jgi:hypothetical protein
MHPLCQLPLTISLVFYAAECRVPFAIGVFSPSGYIDTLYLDEDLRISKGEPADTQ